eukprot:7749319-Alexandrium_andersonii.AAC.1
MFALGRIRVSTHAAPRGTCTHERTKIQAVAGARAGAVTFAQQSRACTCAHARELSRPSHA